MNNFCTISSIKYIVKLLTLYNSLKNKSRFTLWVLCMDDASFKLLDKMNLKHLKLIKLEEVEDNRLLEVKKDRKENEYCWTLKSCLMEYILNKYSVSKVVYCDSDLYFFKDCSSIFKKLKKYSIYLTPQRDLDWVEKIYGKYQAGLIGFKNDDEGLKALRWWKEKCINWCYKINDLDNERWGDQKYLDKIPELFENYIVEKDLGINAAPWNSIYSKTYELKEKLRKPYIQKDSIKAFHFATMEIFNKNAFDLWSLGEIEMSNLQLRNLYIPYIEKLQKSIDQIIKIYPEFKSYLSTKTNNAKTLFEYEKNQKSRYRSLYYYQFCSIVSREYLLKALALYYSLRIRAVHFHIWFCVMDKSLYKTLQKMKLKNVTLISVEDIEKKDIELLRIKNDRKMKEYCWTLKPALIEYVMDNYKARRLVYCDCDVYFSSSPKVVYKEWSTYSCFMCIERKLEEWEYTHGIYRSELLGFKNDDYGRDILRWWKRQCFNWCYDYVDSKNERYRDKRYLIYVPRLFENIKICDTIEIRATPRSMKQMMYVG